MTVSKIIFCEMLIHIIKLNLKYKQRAKIIIPMIFYLNSYFDIFSLLLSSIILKVKVLNHINLV